MNQRSLPKTSFKFIITWTALTIAIGVILSIFLKLIGILIADVVYIASFVILVKRQNPNHKNLLTLVVVLIIASLLSLAGGLWLLSNGWAPNF